MKLSETLFKSIYSDGISGHIQLRVGVCVDAVDISTLVVAQRGEIADGGVTEVDGGQQEN